MRSAPHRFFTSSITSGAVGDYALDCTGGTAGMAVPINFHSFMNVSVLTPGVWTLTDGTHNVGGIARGLKRSRFPWFWVQQPGAGHLSLMIGGYQSMSIRARFRAFTRSGKT